MLGWLILDAERTKRRVACKPLPDGEYAPLNKTRTDRRSGFCKAKVLKSIHRAVRFIRSFNTFIDLKRSALKAAALFYIKLTYSIRQLGLLRVDKHV